MSSGPLSLWCQSFIPLRRWFSPDQTDLDECLNINFNCGCTQRRLDILKDTHVYAHSENTCGSENTPLKNLLNYSYVGIFN